MKTSGIWLQEQFDPGPQIVTSGLCLFFSPLALSSSALAWFSGSPWWQDGFLLTSPVLCPPRFKSDRDSSSPLSSSLGVWLDQLTSRTPPWTSYWDWKDGTKTVVQCGISVCFPELGMEPPPGPMDWEWGMGVPRENFLVTPRYERGPSYSWSFMVDSIGPSWM